MNEMYNVYVKLSECDFITAVSSSAFITKTAGWVKLDSGYGPKYYHAQNGYFPNPITTESGVYRYKLVDGVAVECSADEIKMQEEAAKPRTVAPRNIVAGEYITVGGVLYRATMNIPNGGKIITGQNAVVTTVEEQLYELTKGA